MTKPLPHISDTGTPNMEAFIGGVYDLWPLKNEATSAETIAFVLRVLKVMDPIIARALESDERDAHILDLRGKKADGKAITWKVISLRVGLSRTAVHDAIKRHTLARRAAWRAAS